MSSIRAAVLIVVSAGIICRAPPHSQSAPQSGCTTIPGHFRGEFWHYYLRGNAQADCSMWPEAEADYREAIKQRPDDQIKDLKSDQTVYIDKLVIEGKASSDKPVTAVSCQGRPLKLKPGPIVYFSRLEPLKEGDNTILIAAAGRRKERME